MANYTACLYEVVELLDTYDPPRSLFPPEYTLFDPAHKEELEGKIMAHYWQREIGQETPDAFITYFRTTFLEALVLANKRYEVMAHKFELFRNRIETTTRGRTATGDATGENTNVNESNGKAVNEATPYTSYPEGSNYSTDRATTEGTVNTTGNTNTHSESTETEDVTVEGLSGMTEARAAREYMEMLVDVDMEIIRVLEPCFMQIF